MTKSPENDLDDEFTVMQDNLNRLAVEFNTYLQKNSRTALDIGMGKLEKLRDALKAFQQNLASGTYDDTTTKTALALFQINNELRNSAGIPAELRSTLSRLDNSILDIINSDKISMSQPSATTSLSAKSLDALIDKMRENETEYRSMHRPKNIKKMKALVDMLVQIKNESEVPVFNKKGKQTGTILTDTPEKKLACAVNAIENALLAEKQSFINSGWLKKKDVTGFITELKTESNHLKYARMLAYTLKDAYKEYANLNIRKPENLKMLDSIEKSGAKAAPKAAAK